MLTIVFRVDSSEEMGIGHCMRCLTLAVQLRDNGHSILFICKNHKGSIHSFVQESGFSVVLIEVDNRCGSSDGSIGSETFQWLGGCQEADAVLCIDIFQLKFPQGVDWVIVDHYGIDSVWEKLVGQYVKKVMAIDDMPGREHDCHLLLDQTLGRKPVDYYSIVPIKTKLLLGAQYILLRKEFNISREEVLELRRNFRYEQGARVLVMMGGTDHQNVTAGVLTAIRKSSLDCMVTVILGSTAVYIDDISNICNEVQHFNLLVGSSSVASIMMNHDLCVGAPGTTSWERCVLGLPSIVISFADNQKSIEAALVNAGAALSLPHSGYVDLIESSIRDICRPNQYMEMVGRSLAVSDGQGVERVIGLIEAGAGQH